MATPSNGGGLPRLPQQIYAGDLTEEERRVLRIRYRRILKQSRRGEKLSETDQALMALLPVFMTMHVVTLDNLETLVDAEFDDAEQDQGGPTQIDSLDAEEAFEASIAERSRARAELRMKYEVAYRILMNPTRRTTN